MFGVCICAWAGHVAPASSATIAAVPNCLIGCSLSFGRYIPPGKRVRQAQLGEALKGDRRLKAIGPAGFLGLQPVLPDRPHLVQPSARRRPGQSRLPTPATWPIFSPLGIIGYELR